MPGFLFPINEKVELAQGSHINRPVNPDIVNSVTRGSTENSETEMVYYIKFVMDKPHSWMFLDKEERDNEFDRVLIALGRP